MYKTSIISVISSISLQQMQCGARNPAAPRSAQHGRHQRVHYIRRAVSGVRAREGEGGEG